MLLFRAADTSDLPNLEAHARRYLAGQSVCEDSAALHLNAAPEKQATTTRDQAHVTLDARLRSADQWLLTPVQEGIKPVEWETDALTGSGDGSLKRAGTAAVNGGLLIVRWSPEGLQQEFARYRWKNDAPPIGVKTRWQQLATYNYLCAAQSGSRLVAQ
jgi:hypothetical protein